MSPLWLALLFAFVRVHGLEFEVDAGGWLRVEPVQLAEARLMLDGRHLVHVAALQSLVWPTPLSPGLHVAAVYSVVDGTYTLVDHSEVRAPHRDGERTMPTPREVFSTDAHYATYYTTINYHESQAFQAASRAARALVPSVEDVIRSNGQLVLRDILGHFPANLYHDTPLLGYYCLYRSRPNDTSPGVECNDTTAVLSSHADMLSATGISYMLLDDSNLGGESPEDLIMQVRPAQVIYDAFASFHAYGRTVPMVGAWNTVREGSTQWQDYLDMYNSGEYASVVLRLNTTNAGVRKVFFVVWAADDKDMSPDLIRQIEHNGGRNDITVVKMWGNVAASTYASGVHAFMAPCLTPDQHLTTTITPQAPCNHPTSRGSPVGSQSALSLSYQVMYGSLPFQSSSRLEGLTFKKQFADALRDQPDHVLVPSFNEHTAMPFASPFPHTQGSVGLEWDAGRFQVWVDTFGADRSRGWEPTRQQGDRWLQLVRSCLRVYTLSRNDSSLRSCRVVGEVCCQMSAPENITNVWSLVQHGNTNATLLTNSEHEKEVLTRPGGGWKEVCSGLSGTSAFCVDANIEALPFALQGPFLLMAVSNGTAYSAPVYRCLNSTTSLHFLSVHSDCDHLGTAESILGYTALQRTSSYPRSLRSCCGSRFYHRLEAPCDAGETEKHLGFVI